MSQKHVINSTDRLAHKDVANFKRRAQKGNTCVPTVMEYINKLLNRDDTFDRKTFVKFFQEQLAANHGFNFKIKNKGVPNKMIPRAMMHYFGNNIIGNIAYGNTPFNYKACIDNGSVS